MINFLVFTLPLVFPAAQAIQCYICDSPTNRTCASSDPATLRPFIKQCNDRYPSWCWSTQPSRSSGIIWRGDVVRRGCYIDSREHSPAFSGCRETDGIALSVLKCYCRSDRCNGNITRGADNFSGDKRNHQPYPLWMIPLQVSGVLEGKKIDTNCNRRTPVPGHRGA